MRAIIVGSDRKRYAGFLSRSTKNFFELESFNITNFSKSSKKLPKAFQAKSKPRSTNNLTSDSKKFYLGKITDFMILFMSLFELNLNINNFMKKL